MTRHVLIALTVLMLVAGAVPAVAQEAALEVAGNAVGIGTSTPAAPLHVFRTDGTAQLRVEEDSGTSASRTLFHLENNGGVRFIFNDTLLGSLWEFSNKGGSIIFNRGSGINEFWLEPNGDLTISGDLVANGVFYASSRDLKQDFEPVSGMEVLDRLVQLPITTWSYSGKQSTGRHLGPVAEDFAAAFDLGGDDAKLSVTDVAGVAIAAIQGLNARLEERGRDVEELRREIGELTRLVEELKQSRVDR